MRLRVTCFDDVGFCFCVVSFLKLPSPWRNIYLYLYICIALIRLLFDKCILFVYLKSNGMFPLERFLNLFKYVPLEKPEIFDARDILSQVLVFDLVGFSLFPPPSPCSTVVVIWFACWTSGPCFPMGLCGWGFAYLTLAPLSVVRIRPILHQPKQKVRLRVTCFDDVGFLFLCSFILETSVPLA